MRELEHMIQTARIIEIPAIVYRESHNRTLAHFEEKMRRERQAPRKRANWVRITTGVAVLIGSSYSRC